MDEEAITALRGAAVAMHEMYRELRGAGFNQHEAIEMIVRMFQQATREDAPDA